MAGKVVHDGIYEEHHNALSSTQLHEAFHYVTNSDPGAVGAGKYWLDTSVTPRALKRRNSTDTGWDSVGLAANPTYALNDLSDVVITAGAEGEVLGHNGTNFVDAMNVNFTLGPFFADDIPGTATTQMTLPFFNTATALSRTGNDVRMSRSGRVIGAAIVSDAARTAGTATVEVRVGGVSTAFDGGAVQLSASPTTSDTSFVGYVNGVSFSAGDALGMSVVTSGWTPTTANVIGWIIVQLAPYTG